MKFSHYYKISADVVVVEVEVTGIELIKVENSFNAITQGYNEDEPISTKLYRLAALALELEAVNA